MDMEETTKKKPLTKDEIIQELMNLLKQNNMQSQANEVFEICSYVEGLEKKLEGVMGELTQVKEQLKQMQELQAQKELKAVIHRSVKQLEHHCQEMKKRIFEIKGDFTQKAESIVADVKQKGKEVLNRIVEFTKLKQKLFALHDKVSVSVKETEQTIAKIDAFGNGMREAVQKTVNTFRTFADQEEVNYSKQEKKFTKTDVVKKPWQLKKRMLESMGRRLDAAMGGLDMLAKDVEQKKIKQHENADGHSIEKQEVEHIPGEVVPALPIVAEAGFQYGSEAFDEYKNQQQNQSIISGAAQPGATIIIKRRL